MSSKNHSSDWAHTFQLPVLTHSLTDFLTVVIKNRQAGTGL